MGFQAMRVRMQDDGDAIAHLVRFVVPVRIDISDMGFPEDVPGLRWHRRALEESPWIRRRFGHFALLDSRGEQLLAVDYGDVDVAIAGALHSAADPDAAPDPNGFCAATPLPDHLAEGVLSRRWMTAYELSLDHWRETIDIVADGEGLAPGVRNAALHAYGEFLAAPLELDLGHFRAVSRGMRVLAGHRPRREGTGPPDLERRAAIAVARIAGLGYADGHPGLVERTRNWWSCHREEEAFAIEWSTDPRLRYAFLDPSERHRVTALGEHAPATDACRTEDAAPARGSVEIEAEGDQVGGRRLHRVGGALGHGGQGLLRGDLDQQTVGTRR